MYVICPVLDQVYNTETIMLNTGRSRASMELVHGQVKELQAKLLCQAIVLNTGEIYQINDSPEAFIERVHG